MKFKVGDIVACAVHAGIVKARVEEICGESYRPYLALRREWPKWNPAKVYPQFNRDVDNVIRWNACDPRAGDPTTANVFADYLEEQGEDRAAAMLREAFPMVGEKEPT